MKIHLAEEELFHAEEWTDIWRS